MTESHHDHTAPKSLRDIPISILDLAPITAGSTAAHSLRNTLELAQHAEKWVITDIGSPNTIICPALPVPLPPWSSAMSPAVLGRFA